MLLQIANVLSQEFIAECRQLATRDGLFEDGRNTAGWHARQRKHNLQARTNASVTALLRKAEQLVLRHELVVAAARPRSIVRMMLSRYDETMHYGNHVDDALMDGARTDLSFTLFLSGPDEYDGGGLVIDEPSAERVYKLDSGSMLLYPSSSLHRVESVTQGKRLVIVGWIRSFVRSRDAREILFDLERVIASLRARQETGELELLLKTRSNLLRMWAED